MNMDKKSLLGMLFCVLFYLAYTHYLNTKYPPDERREAAKTASLPQETPAPATQQPAAPAEVTSITQRLSDKDLVIETDTSIYRFSQDQSAISSIELKNHLGDEKKEPINILDAKLYVQGTTDPGQLAPFTGGFNGEREDRTIRFWRVAGDWRIAQEFKVPQQGYGLELKVSFTNNSTKPLELNASVLNYEAVHFKKPKPGLSFLPGMPEEMQSFVYSHEGSVERLDTRKICEKDPKESAVRVNNALIDYFGIDTHYFLKLLLPSPSKINLSMQPAKATAAHCELAMVASEPHGDVQPGETVTLAFTGFFGPKEIDVLRAVKPGLESAIDLGIFGVIARPLLFVIQGFYKLTGNYGLAIILLTALLKVIFFPLVKASSTSMHKMKQLNPQMQSIRDRFKDDRQRQQQELMKFMAQHKINPMKGCLPILPQIPVFFAFYQVLRNAIELRHAPFFGWIQDLSAMDPFYVTPILLGIAMFVQQKLTPTTGMDKTQEKVLMFMPILFAAMMLSLPAGMTLYMLTNTVIGIAQQKWLYMKLDKQAA